MSEDGIERINSHKNTKLLSFTYVWVKVQKHIYFIIFNRKECKENTSKERKD
jgi:hypothetical protein